MKEYVFKVEGMHCEGCEARITRAFKAKEEVEEVRANYKTKEVHIKSEENKQDDFLETFEDLGFQATLE